MGDNDLACRRNMDKYGKYVRSKDDNDTCLIVHCFIDPRVTAPASAMPRTRPSTLTGEWKVFYISAVPILETDVDTGIFRPDPRHASPDCIINGVQERVRAQSRFVP